MDPGAGVGGSGSAANPSDDGTNTAMGPQTSNKRPYDSADYGSVDDSDSDIDRSELGLSDCECEEPKSKKQKNTTMSSLRDLAEKALITQIEKAVDGPKANALYCCGGAVNGGLDSTLTLRWDDPTESSIVRKIEFPAPGNSNDVQALLRAYRATGTLTKRQFSINSDLYTQSIFSTINTTLLPGFQKRSGSKTRDDATLRAEISKLHVRGAGTDAGILDFQSSQLWKLGKLVVCLPCAHEGGELEVSNGGHKTTFEWARFSTRIQWAAFFQECEHKMRPVKAGCQIILTFTLYLDQVGHLISPTRSTPMDATLFPLYEGVRSTLETPGFMKNGGILGFYCRYSYPHLNSNVAQRLHHQLLGVDRVIFTVFSSLGLKVEMKPLLDFSSIDDNDRFEYEMDEQCYEDDPWGMTGTDPCPCGECYPPFPDFEEWRAARSKFDAIGTAFHPLTRSETIVEADWQREEKEHGIKMAWKYDKYHDIKWVNQHLTRNDSTQGPWKLAVLNLQHCDDDVLPAELYYSLPVILVTIPNMVDRNLKDVMYSALKREA